MRILRLGALVAAVSTIGIVASAQAIVVHVQSTPAVRENIHLRFSAPELPAGGYYYGVVVVKPYKHYTRHSPPPCSTSSNMQRTDYGYPQPTGVVALALTPARSTTWHWCRGGSYEGAIYAVPHAPPCESAYPCGSEPGPSPCWQTEGGRRVCGVAVRPKIWAYPEPLPRPLASGTTIVAHFAVRFPVSHR